MPNTCDVLNSLEYPNVVLSLTNGEAPQTVRELVLTVIEAGNAAERADVLCCHVVNPEEGTVIDASQTVRWNKEMVASQRVAYGELMAACNEIIAFQLYLDRVIARDLSPDMEDDILHLARAAHKFAYDECHDNGFVNVEMRAKQYIAFYVAMQER